MTSPSNVALAFECVKVALKQDRTGFVLTLSIHPDEIPVELLRMPEIQKLLVDICNDIWNQAVCPEDWYQGLFVNIYKGKVVKTAVSVTDLYVCPSMHTKCLLSSCLCV